MSHAVIEASEALGIRRSAYYELITLGDILSNRLDGRILVRRAALERLVGHG
jgi:hypothetical protein